MDNEKIQSVSSLTNRIKSSLESEFPFVWVRGQVANLSRPSSGHIYFSLKDENASIAAVWFKGSQSKGSSFDPLTGEEIDRKEHPPIATSIENGQELICLGKLTVYESRGVYQLIIELAQEAGIGRLHAEFERLKSKLYNEGYFSLERKRPLPTKSRRVAVITAPTSAAIQDFVRIASQRGSGASIRIYPSKVQGNGAAEEIIGQISRVQQEKWAEVLVLIRGGGSLEDLWEFNKEMLATAIKYSPIPVIAGIGHEVDFTLADMTADVRAATPSHAAQLLWADRREFFEAIERQAHQLTSAIENIFNGLDQFLDDTERLLNAKSPLKRLDTFEIQLKSITPRLQFSIERHFQRSKEQLQAVERIFHTVQGRVKERQKDLFSLVQRFNFIYERWLEKKQKDIELLDITLSSLDPLKPIDRGYAVLYTKDSIVKNIHDIALGEDLSILVKGGSIEAHVKSVNVQVNNE